MRLPGSWLRVYCFRVSVPHGTAGHAGGVHLPRALLGDEGPASAEGTGDGTDRCLRGGGHRGP